MSTRDKLRGQYFWTISLETPEKDRANSWAIGPSSISFWHKKYCPTYQIYMQNFLLRTTWLTWMRTKSHRRSLSLQSKPVFWLKNWWERNTFLSASSSNQLWRVRQCHRRTQGWLQPLNYPFQVCKSEKPFCSACRYLTRLRIKWSYVKDIIGVSRRQSCQIEDTSCNHTWIRLSVVPFPFAPNRSRITGCVGGRKGANSRIAISKILAPTDGWFFLVFHRTRYPNSMDVILYARRIDSKSDRSSSS